MKLDNDMLIHVPLIMSIVVFGSGICFCFTLCRKIRSGTITGGGGGSVFGDGAPRTFPVSRWEEPRRFWGFVAVALVWLFFWFGFGIFLLLEFFHLRAG